MSIKIINATRRTTTTERVLWLVRAYPQGITVKELSKHLNRPISMINLCLKSLIADKQIDAQFDEELKQCIYYPITLALSI